MFIMAVCVLFLVKLRWPKTKSLSQNFFTGLPVASTWLKWIWFFPLFFCIKFLHKAACIRVNIDVTRWGDRVILIEAILSSYSHDSAARFLQISNSSQIFDFGSKVMKKM